MTIRMRREREKRGWPEQMARRLRCARGRRQIEAGAWRPTSHSSRAREGALGYGSKKPSALLDKENDEE